MSIKKIFNYFLNCYEGEKFMVVRKAQANLITNFACGVFSFLYLLVQLLTTRDPLIMIIFFIAVFVFSICCILLKHGRLRLASILSIMLIFIGLSISGYATTFRTVDTLYLLVLLLLFVGILSLFIGFWKYHLAFICIAGAFVISSFFVTHIIPYRAEMNDKIDVLVTSAFIFGLGSAILLYIEKFINAAIERAEKEAEKNKRKYEELESIIESSSEGIEIGTRLRQVLANTLGSARRKSTPSCRK